MEDKPGSLHWSKKNRIWSTRSKPSKAPSSENCIWKERAKLRRPLKGFPVPQKLPSREITPQGQHKETEAATIQTNQTLLQASRRALWQCTHGTDWTGMKRWRLEGAIGSGTTVSQTHGGQEMCGRVGDPSGSCWKTTAYSCEGDTKFTVEAPEYWRYQNHGKILSGKLRAQREARCASGSKVG